MKLKTKTYKKPSMLDVYTLRKAAELHQRANPSDRFAYGRVTLHMQQGYDLPSDVIADAQSKLAARGQKTEYLG
jgi:hypothetical protein